MLTSISLSCGVPQAVTTFPKVGNPYSSSEDNGSDDREGEGARECVCSTSMCLSHGGEPPCGAMTTVPGDGRLHDSGGSTDNNGPKDGRDGGSGCHGHIYFTLFFCILYGFIQ